MNARSLPRWLALAAWLVTACGRARAPAAAAPAATDLKADDEHAPPTGPTTVIRGVIRRAKEREVRERRARVLDVERALLAADAGAAQR